MQNAATAIDRCIDQSIRSAPVLGLHVKDRLSYFHIRVMPKEHRFRPLPRRPLADNLAAGVPAGFFSRHLTDWRLNGYYSPSLMTDSGLQAYTPLLLHLLIATALAGALTAASVLVGWRRPSR